MPDWFLKEYNLKSLCHNEVLRILDTGRQGSINSQIFN